MIMIKWELAMSQWITSYKKYLRTIIRNNGLHSPIGRLVNLSEWAFASLLRFPTKTFAFVTFLTPKHSFFVTPLLLFKPRATEKTHTHTHGFSGTQHYTTLSRFLLNHYQCVYGFLSEVSIFGSFNVVSFLVDFLSLTLLSLCNFCFSVYHIIFDFPLFFLLFVNIISLFMSFLKINVHKNKLFFSFYMIFVAF